MSTTTDKPQTNSKRTWRIVIVFVLLTAGLIWVWQTQAAPERISLFITAVIGAVTTIYALFTYEILLLNQATAKAALDSSTLMERSLRFSHTPNLIFETINTKDPTFKSAPDITPIENQDYTRAINEFKASGEQKEFVFAVIKNKGQGAATNLSVEATYDITDSSNPNREATVSKQALVQILEPQKGKAICIFISILPTPDDRVTLVSARLRAGDFYRDAINEPAQQLEIGPRTHHVEHAADCVVRIA